MTSTESNLLKRHDRDCWTPDGLHDRMLHLRPFILTIDQLRSIQRRRGSMQSIYLSTIAVAHHDSVRLVSFR
jgi:hypothetical protein